MGSKSGVDHDQLLLSPIDRLILPIMRPAAAVIIATLGVAVAACNSAGGARPAAAPRTTHHAHAPQPFTVNGRVVLGPHLTYRADDPVGSRCYTPGNLPGPVPMAPSKLDDIRQGAQVVIRDAANRTVGVATLGAGVTMDPVVGHRGFPRCLYSFVARDVPPSRFYDVSVGSAAHSIQVPLEQMRNDPTITLSQ